MGELSSFVDRHCILADARQLPQACCNMPPKPHPEITGTAMTAIRRGLAQSPRRPFVLGICGAQGSGKSTLAEAIMRQCSGEGIAAASLSLDDLYLTRAERVKLARNVHPLLVTRGVPGTHDIALGLEVLAAMERGEAPPLPRFEKARDDRSPPQDWGQAPAGCAVLVLEGWCVGALPQAEAELRDPINQLEAGEDAAGVWRRYANTALGGAYQRLFARIDSLLLLAAPGFEVVFNWRREQEEALRAAAGPDAPGLMDATAIARFIQHYERLTRHILSEMPARADIVVRLDEDRAPLEIVQRSERG